MGKQNEENETTILLDTIVSSMQEKKGKKIISLDLDNIPDTVTQYFVICHGNSSTQVEAIYKEIIDNTEKKHRIKPFHTEGYNNSEWILIDYFDIVVHVFRDDIRDFYKLEDLWADAIRKEYRSDE